MDRNVELENLKPEAAKETRGELDVVKKSLDPKVNEIIRIDHVPSKHEINYLKAIGRNRGFPDKATRLGCYKKIFFSSPKSSTIDKIKTTYSNSTTADLNKVKESSTIDKDANRSQFNYYTGEKLEHIQACLSKMLKSVFSAYPDAAYY